MPYIDFPLEVDPDSEVQDFIDKMQRIFDLWQPNEAQIEMAVAEEVIRLCTETALISTEVAAAIFRKFGAETIGIPPLQGAPASTLSTWVMADNFGYTLPAGTVVGFPIAGDEFAFFATALDVVIPVGSTTATGVTITALDVGEDRNDLPVGPLTLVDALGFVSTVTSTAATDGGVDEETDDEYLDRLNESLQTLTQRPIRPEDFVKLSRHVVGVWRARCLDLYNPDDGSFGNPRMVTLVPVARDGTTVTAGVRQALAQYIAGLREVNFIVNTMDPTYAKVDITFQVVSLPGYKTTDVHADIAEAIIKYIDPANFAGGDQAPPIWTNTSIIRYLELAALINNIEGVDYIAPGGLLLNGGTTDLVMTGSPATLPKRVGSNPAVDSTVEGVVGAP